MIEMVIIPELEDLAELPADGRVPWTPHDSEIAGKYYRIGAITCDDIRRHLDHPNRTDNAIGIEAGRWRKEQGRV